MPDQSSLAGQSPLPGFGSGFLFGVSSSAYQIEGATTADGRGPSTWDSFSAQPGRTHRGDTGLVACDHYHRYREDVALMAGLGVDAYRFSIGWPRVQPTGSGPANPAGLDFYDRLVDCLLDAGIEPVPTLYHWDTPQPLEDAGGWLDRIMADRFADYTQIVADRFGDRVNRWITLNEPVALTYFGYGVGAHAPGKTLLLDALPAAHHQLLAHARAAAVLRAAGGSVGIASNHCPILAASSSPADTDAAAFYDNLYNWLFADPIIRGDYPAGLAERMPGTPSQVAADLAEINGSVDWYGINYYAPAKVGAPAGLASTGPTDGVELPDGLPFELRDITGLPMTDFDWPVVPSGLADLLQSFSIRYGDRLPPLVITENGCAFNDSPGPDGSVDDTRRIQYLESHLRVLHGAIAAGADVRGYFHWSLTDNFEWTAGYSQRFGLVHIDYATLARTPKASYAWYRDLISASRTERLPAGDEPGPVEEPGA